MDKTRFRDNLMIIVGPPGMGKSTLCKEFSDKEGKLFKDSDVIIEQGMYPHSQNEIDEADKLEFNYWWKEMNDINPLLFAHAQGVYLSNFINNYKSKFKHDRIIGYFPVIMLIELIKGVKIDIDLSILFLDMDLHDLNMNTEIRYKIKTERGKDKNNCDNVRALNTQEDCCNYIRSLSKEGVIRPLSVAKMKVTNANLSSKLEMHRLKNPVNEIDYGNSVKLWILEELKIGDKNGIQK